MTLSHRSNEALRKKMWSSQIQASREAGYLTTNQIEEEGDLPSVIMEREMIGEPNSVVGLH